MSNPVGYTPYYYDSRGNRLESWKGTAAPGGHVLWLRGPVEATRQIRAAAPQYQEIALPAGASTSGWTHSLYSPETSVSPFVEALLSSLQRILTVPSPPGVEFAFALDWYKNPVDGLDSFSWPNSEVGELVSKGKYWYRSQAEPQAEAGRALAARLCDAISGHALLRNAEIVLNVPGHDNSRLSFGSRLAATVARDMGLPMSRVATRTPFRPESKNYGGAELARLLADEFEVSPEVRGRTALIVDDVIRSGGSMSAVAAAAHATGGKVIFGICAARTMRR